VKKGLIRGDFSPGMFAVQADRDRLATLQRNLLGRIAFEQAPVKAFLILAPSSSSHRASIDPP